MIRKQQMPALTALKGLFIVVIVLHNTFSIIPLFQFIPGSDFIRVFGGALGNAMFFMLSGFLFAYSYREPIGEGRVAFKDFLLRRLKKLYPLYLISNAAALILEIADYGFSALNLEKAAFTVLLQAGGGFSSMNPYNAPAWFVSALFVCYVAFFFISYYTKTPTQYACAVAFGIAWGYTLAHAELAIPFCHPGNGVAFLNFFTGCALAGLLPQINARLHKWLRPTAFLLLAVFFLLLMGYGVEIIAGDFPAACTFVLCPMILYLAQAGGIVNRILQWKPLVALGKISVSIFFWHLVIFKGMCMLFPDGQLQEREYVLYLLALAVCCAASYWMIEKSVLSSKHHETVH